MKLEEEVISSYMQTMIFFNILYHRKSTNACIAISIHISRATLQPVRSLTPILINHKCHYVLYL